MEKIKLTVEQRAILGKKIKKLRKAGILPANIFGKDLKSKAIQLPVKEFKKSYKTAGETGIVELKLKDETYPVLIHKVQYDPITGEIIHADFHRVNLKEKITANVPIRLEGESPAEKSGVGLILQTLNEIEVESLPTDLPHEIIVDMPSLTEVGQTIHVKDLKIDREKVEVKNDPEEVVVSVQTAEMKEEVVEEAPSPEEVEAIEEKGEEEPVEGEEGKKGEKGETKEEKEEPKETA
jgi:large subunit ribosomal protein L25